VLCLYHAQHQNTDENALALSRSTAGIQKTPSDTSIITCSNVD